MGEYGRGIRWRDHFLLYKCIENSSEYGTIPTEQLLNARRQPQTSKRYSQSPQNEIGQKIKKETKDFSTGNCTPEREL